MSSAPSRRRRVVRWALLGALVALVVLVAVVALKLRSNISVVDVSDALAQPTQSPALGDDSDRGPTGPLNILVMGSDTREGQGGGYGSATQIDGARSDTTILVHISADRANVTAVSFPRDLMVTIPECAAADGTTTVEYVDRFNAAFFIGGPECTIRTTTQLTGLPIHHFVVVDFAGFTRTVDALGGVDVCLTRPVDDPKAGLDLPAGVTRVDGDQALAFVRARTSLGDGSDLARIERQQAFLGALVRETTSGSLLTDPVRLVRTLDAATQSLTMDPGLASLPQTTSLARSLAGISPADVSFVTYPNVYNDDFLTVRPEESAALLLHAVLAADVEWPLPRARVSSELEPVDVAVSVVNATGREDQATLAGAALRLQEFAVPELQAGPEQRPTHVRYPGGAKDAATLVAAAVDDAELVRDDSVSGVQLVLGSGFDVGDLRTVKVAAPSDSEDAGEGWVQRGDDDVQGETVTAESSVCAG